MIAISSIYHYFFPTYPREDVFFKVAPLVTHYLNEKDCLSLSLNKTLDLAVNKKLFERKILNHLAPEINFKINALYQTRIFKALIKRYIYENNDPYFDLQKPFIKLLIQESHYDEAFAFAVKYQGTIHEKAFVIFILNELIQHGKIQLMLSFILNAFNSLDYLLIIPKNFLRKDMVDSALSFAHQAKCISVICKGQEINPYLDILKLIINHHLSKGKIYRALGVIFLIEDLDSREKALISFLRMCLKENCLYVIGNITCHITTASNKFLIDKIILSWAIDNYLLRNNLYKDLDIALSISNPENRFENLKYIIRQYIQENKFNLDVCKKYMIDEASLKQLTYFEIHKSIADHYIHSNEIFSALAITSLIPSYHYDRIELLYAILKKLASHSKTDIEKQTNIILAKQIIGMIGTKEIREKFEKKFLPTSIG